MANEIQLKRSSVAGKVPDAANVLVGEPVVNLADRILYTKDGTGNVILVGANLTLQVVNTANTVASSVADVRTIQFDSDSGFDVVDRANGIAKVQMNSTFKTWNVQGQANLVAQGLDVVEFVAGDHILITTDANTDPKQIIFSSLILGDDNAIKVDANGLISFSGVVSVNGANGSVILNTSNIAENGNLYFTNSRVVSALTAGQSITIDANGRINSTATGGGGGSGNYGDANVYANVVLLNYITSSSLSGYATNAQLLDYALDADLTTSNVIEAGNLYFTNARAIAALSAGTGINIDSNGLLTINTGTITASNIAGGSNNTVLIQVAVGETGVVSAPTSNNTVLVYDGNSISWGSVPSISISYSANSISLDPSYGTYNSGNVLSIQTVGDYNLDSNNYYSINETSTTPGYIAYIDFLNVDKFNRIAVNLFYTQNSSHIIYVDLYNNNTSAWDSFGSYNGLGTYYQFALSVLNYTPYKDINDRVQLRLYHASGGNTSHNHRIDYVGLEFVSQGPQGPKGTTGSTGSTGATGPGVATGGTAGQILLKANSDNYATFWGDPTTSNISEGSNLYFTNTRAREALSAGTGIDYNSSTGVIALGDGVDAEFKDLTITGNLLVLGETTTINAREIAISDNMIYLNEAISFAINNVVGDGANVTYTTIVDHGAIVGEVVRITGVNPSSYNQTSYVSIIAVTNNTITIANTTTGSYISGGNVFIKASINPDLGITGGYNDGTYHHAGVFRDASDGNWKFFEGYIPEPDANIFIDTSHVSFSLANVQAKYFVGPVIGNVSDITNHTTTELAEGSNLYFTNARVTVAISTQTLDNATFTGNVVTSANLKANAYIDASNRRLLIKDANNIIVWGN